LNVNYSTGSGKVDVTALFNVDNRPYSLILQTEKQGISVYYTLNGTKPDRSSFLYKKPINIDHDVILKAVAFQDGKQVERPVEFEVVIHKIIGKKMIYRQEFNERYPGNGLQVLNDGLKASLNYNDGYWQGYYGNNLDVVIDLGEDFTFNTISSTFYLIRKNGYLSRKL